MRIASLLNRVLPVGSRSLLFGVHQFIWHPITVAVAWRKLYGKWPTVLESLCIFVHDWGYWGCSNMDGEQGKRHPERGACLASIWCSRLVRWQRWAILPPLLVMTKVGRLALKDMILEREFKSYISQIRAAFNQAAVQAAVRAYYLVLYHSRSMAKADMTAPSTLCGPDKLSVLFDPHWFYWIRASLSGEGREFRQNAVEKIGLQSLSHWLYWYRNSIRKQYETARSLGGVDDKS